MRLLVREVTDRGLRRPHNEDRSASWIPEDSGELTRRGALLVVADGMGGARAGEVASHLAVDAVLRAWREAPGDDPLAELAAAVMAANRVVHAESVTHPERGGMGTTCTAAVLRDHEVLIAHVGDSRGYLVSGGRIRQLTRDHSLVAQLVRDGHLAAEQARTDPRRNVVTRSVGIGAEVEVDAECAAGGLAAGDIVLLCTDGLHALVSDEEIAALASSGDLDRAGEELVSLAKERGGHDNITVVLARLDAA